jgi:hypothetical protein
MVVPGRGEYVAKDDVIEGLDSERAAHSSGVELRCRASLLHVSRNCGRVRRRVDQRSHFHIYKLMFEVP